jgi:hypothetical protein
MLPITTRVIHRLPFLEIGTCWLPQRLLILLALGLGYGVAQLLRSCTF